MPTTPAPHPLDVAVIGGGLGGLAASSRSSPRASSASPPSSRSPGSSARCRVSTAVASTAWASPSGSSTRCTMRPCAGCCARPWPH